MGKINCCLKTVFVIFNSLCTVLGSAMIYKLVKTHDMFEKDIYTRIGIWVTAFAAIGISLLGICASCANSKTGLKIFAGFMGIGMIIMLGCGILVLTSKFQIQQIDQGYITGISFGLFFIAIMVLIIAVRMIKQLGHRENPRTTAIMMTAVVQN